MTTREHQLPAGTPSDRTIPVNGSYSTSPYTHTTRHQHRLKHSDQLKCPQQPHYISMASNGLPSSSDNSLVGVEPRGKAVLSQTAPVATPTPHQHTPLSSSLPLNQLSKGGVNARVPAANESDLLREVPDGQLSVLVGTWNMNEQKELPQSIADFLFPSSQTVRADLVVIGTQESSASRKEWELLLQQTLGPSHVMVDSSSLGVIYLVTFLRRELIWYCSEVHSDGHTTRPGKMIKTKGGVGISFSLFGSSFLFITSHFTAQMDKVSERNLDMSKIATNITFPHTISSVLQEHHYVFWSGDLNYRIELSREAVDQLLADNNHQSLLLNDQLTREILSGDVFKGFSEQPITFPPTYKYDLNSDMYDTSELARTQSWTDRVLFKSCNGVSIRGCGYSSVATIRSSDHKPVYALFKVQLAPMKAVGGVPTRHTSYDRELYIRALERSNSQTRLPREASSLHPQQQHSKSEQLKEDQPVEDEEDALRLEDNQRETEGVDGSSVSWAQPVKRSKLCIIM